jgi:hypothetical protein
MNKLTTHQVMLLAAESYKQALIDTQKVMNEMFEVSFKTYDQNITSLKEKISAKEASDEQN